MTKSLLYLLGTITLFGMVAVSLTACGDDEEPNNLRPDLPCEITAGTLSGGPFAFTVDGFADNVSDVSVSGAAGPKQSFVITDDAGVILVVFGSDTDLEANDFDGAGAGTCRIYHAVYQEFAQGLTRGSNIADLEGCVELSNGVDIVRSACPVSGGTLTALDSTAQAFSVDDEADNLDADNFTVADAEGDDAAYFLTRTASNDAVVLGKYDDLDAVAEVDLETFGLDSILLWYAAVTGPLQGDTIGTTPTEIQGCFALSNPIVLTFTCRADGGVLEANGGRAFSFEVDGEPDNIPDGAVSISGADGAFTTYVVTDADGVILGLPNDLDALEDIDFDAAGDGTCLIWHLSANTALTGDSLGGDATALGGCYDLSNPVEVIRTCRAVGGTLTGGTFDFAVDAEPDFAVSRGDSVSRIELSGAQGESSTYVITDADGVIIALPATRAEVEATDFDALADEDEEDDGQITTRLIWHLSFNGPIGNAEVGNNASDLTGCFALSNPLTVTLTEDAP